MDAPESPHLESAAAPTTLPDPPLLPPPPAFRVVAPRKYRLRLFMIGMSVVFAGSLFIGAKVFSSLATKQTLTMKEVPTKTVGVGKLVTVKNPIDRGLETIRVTKVVRGSAATSVVGQAEDLNHHRVAVFLTVCADDRFNPNGTAAIWLDGLKGAQIFPDPSTAANSLLNTHFDKQRCHDVVLGYGVPATQKIRQVTYSQFPYIRAHWNIPARSTGSTS